MGQLIEVPGQGQVEFPDGMSDDQIVEAIKRNSAPDHSGVHESIRALMPPKTVGAAMAINNKPPATPAAGRDTSLDAYNEPTHAADTAPPDAPGTLPWSDLPGNIVPSAKAFAGNIWHAVSHPVDTAKAVGGLAKSALAQGVDPDMLAAEASQRIVNPEGAQASADSREAYAKENAGPINALAQAQGDRYGSLLKLRNTIIGDPVGFAADASIVAPAGAAVLPGRVASAVGKVGRALDPVVGTADAVTKGAKLAEPAVSQGLGLTTGAGADSVRAAAKAGAEGGETAKAFTSNMRGAPTQEIVDRAKAAVSELRQERSDAYKAGKIELGEDNTPIKFQPIEDAVDKAAEVGKHGSAGVTVEPAAVATVDKMRAIVEEWSYLDPAEYHTPVGIDALKRSLGNIRDSTKYGTPERVAANRLYGAVRDELTAVAPKYSSMMESYAKASDTIKEAEKTFSLTEKATGDTSSRKLLSSMRNDVQANFGERKRLLDTLAEKDPTLPAAIAGQGFNSLAPRGLLARASLPFMVGSAIHNPAALPLLAASSPRLVGEGAYLAGRSAAGTRDVANALGLNGDMIRAVEQGAFQGGRADEPQSMGPMALAFRRALERRNALARH